METPRPRFIGHGRSWKKAVPIKGCETLNEGRKKRESARERE